MIKESKTHDYTSHNRRWGHDIYFTPKNKGMELDAGGWGYGINKGDFILLTNRKDNSITRYQVDSIKYEGNPSDMWRGVLKFAPRQVEAQS